MTRALLLAAAVTCAIALPAAADPALRAAPVIIAGAEIRLGDVFAGLEPAAADIVIAPAPAPGARAVFAGVDLDRVAAAHGVTWRGATRFDRVVIERAATVIGPDLIQAALAEALAASDLDAGGTARVVLDARSARITLPAEAPADLAVISLTPDATGRRIEAELEAAPGTHHATRTVVTGRLVRTVSVPVLARRLAAGEIVTDADLTLLEVPAERLTPDLVRDGAELVGRAARRGTAVNRPLRAADFEAPRLVRRNRGVTMIARNGALVVTARGRAQTDGGEGETVRVLNPSSMRVVEAVVTGPDEVSIIVN